MMMSWALLVSLVLAVGEATFASPGMMNAVYGTTKRFVHGNQQPPHHIPYWPAYAPYPSYWAYASPYQHQQVANAYDIYGGYMAPRDRYLQMYPIDARQYQRPYGYVVYDDSPLEGEEIIEEDPSMDPIDELEEEFGRETWYEQPAAPATAAMQHLQQQANQVGWYDNYYTQNEDPRVSYVGYGHYQPQPHMQQMQMKRTPTPVQTNQIKQGMKEVAMLRPPVPVRRLDDGKIITKATEATTTTTDEPLPRPEHRTQSVYDAIKQLIAMDARISSKNGNTGAEAAQVNHKTPQKRFVSNEESLESELTRLKKLNV